jgi:hypothetical protein
MSMDLYMCIAVATSTNINMRTCVAKMCLVASAVLSFSHSKQTGSTARAHLAGKMMINHWIYVDSDVLKTCGTRQFWLFIYLYIYIYNLLKLWGQILKCEVISSMFYVQPLTYCINLYNLYCLRRIKKTPNWFKLDHPDGYLASLLVKSSQSTHSQVPFLMFKSIVLGISRKSSCFMVEAFVFLDESW